MASLMEELLDVLGKEEKQYQELITLASEKTDASGARAISNILRMLRRESRMLRACFLIFPIKETVS